MLEAAGSELWIAEGEIVDFHGFAFPTRAVIVRLSSGSLWGWSPVRLTAELRQAVTDLGPVGHLVSPNKLHHLYLTEWLAAFPQAKLWGPASTIKKRRDLTFEASLEDRPPVDWGDEIDLAWFRGSPAMDEIVFLHKASRTAILADLSENFSEAFLEAHWSGWQRPLARLSKIVEGRGYTPLDWRVLWFDREPARAALKKVLAWHPEAVIMAHGEWQREGGVPYLKRALAWLAAEV